MSEAPMPWCMIPRSEAAIHIVTSSALQIL